MDIQAHKLEFLAEYLRINDEDILLKLSTLLHRERQKRAKSSLQPMTQEQLLQKLEKAESDLTEGKILSQQEVEAYFKNKRITQ